VANVSSYPLPVISSGSGGMLCRWEGSRQSKRSAKWKRENLSWQLSASEGKLVYRLQRTIRSRW